MEVQERLRNEQAFHDRQACVRATFLKQRPEKLIVHEKDYLNHEPWIGPALATFGDVRGGRVLDFGCGHGMAALVLAQRGADVTALDLSGGYLNEANIRAKANGMGVDFVQANGEYLPFADESFDYIWGNAVLHHLDLRRAGQELRRVLKSDGLAVFCEPWGGNALLNWVRRRLPYPGKARTTAEAPLNQRDVEVLRGIFPEMAIDGQQLFSMVSRVLGRSWFVKTLAWWDHQILKWFPASRHWCRYVVITLRK